VGATTKRREKEGADVSFSPTTDRTDTGTATPLLSYQITKSNSTKMKGLTES
jgi:hypothetical protein